jgi:hypothetical protein
MRIGFLLKKVEVIALLKQIEWKKNNENWIFT